jgi:hypothetical protein
MSQITHSLLGVFIMLRQLVNTTYRLGAGLGLALISTLSAQAMSISTYRIYLDSENSSASFVMYNATSLEESCKLSLVHHNFDEFGTISAVDSAVLPDNSASPWIRYSPKNFSAAALSPQTVRFTLRRKANTSAQEYRSYLRVYCKANETASSKSESTTTSISVKPRMVQNVPIIVQVNFSNFHLVDNSLHFDIHRQGNRSVYGKIELIDKKSGEVISYRKNISIYTETNLYKYELPSSDKALNELGVRFVEDTKFGGSIDYQQDATVN